MIDTRTNDSPDTAPDAGPRPRTNGEIAYDSATVFVLIVGGFVVPIAGWIAGVVLLWNGPRFDRTWRWIGTLAWPVAVAALVGVLVLVGPAHAAFALTGVAVLVALIVVFALLGRAAARGRRR